MKRSLLICLILLACSLVFAACDQDDIIPLDTTTASPETTAPETTAPETTAPETTAPETTAPETTVEETTVEETTAEETTAEETTAEETSAVSAEMPVLSSASLTIDGKVISGRFSHATDEFRFMEDITVTGNAIWVVSMDVYGGYSYATKTVPLEEGDNTYYIHVTNPDQSVTTYTVNLYRNHLYTLYFDANGGTKVANQYVEEGHLATEPKSERAGYILTSWDGYDFSIPVTASQRLTASWTARTDIPYTVEYYLQNVNRIDFELYETVSLTGTTDTLVTAEEKNYEHFWLNTMLSSTSGTVHSGGSLVLRAYYSRKSYTVTACTNDDLAGTVTQGGIYAYEKEITLTATTNPGYTFVGWYEDDRMVCDTPSYTFEVDHDATYTATWSPNTDIPYRVEYYVRNVYQTGYDLMESYDLVGTAGATVYAEQKTFEHFILNGPDSTLEATVKGDGSLVMKVYYSRYMYTVSAENGTIRGAGTYNYDPSHVVKLIAYEPPLGYVFLGWYSGDKLLSSEYEFETVVDRDIVARFGVATEMQNFVL